MGHIIARETVNTLAHQRMLRTESYSSGVGVVDSANARVTSVGVGASILARVQGLTGITWIVTDLAQYGGDTCRGDKKSDSFVKLNVRKS